MKLPTNLVLSCSDRLITVLTILYSAISFFVSWLLMIVFSKCNFLFVFCCSRTQFRRRRCILGDPNCFITTYRPCPWSIIRRRKTINRTYHPTITGQWICGVMGVVSAWTSCSSRGVPLDYISKGFFFLNIFSGVVAGGPWARKRDVSDRTHSSVMKKQLHLFLS